MTKYASSEIFAGSTAAFTHKDTTVSLSSKKALGRAALTISPRVHM